jgi:hypothetical protein
MTLVKETDDETILLIKCFGNLLKLFTSNLEHFQSDYFEKIFQGCNSAMNICENLVQQSSEMMQIIVSDARYSRTVAKLLECLKSGVQIHCQHRISSVSESECLMLSRENRRLVSKLSDRADEMGKRLLLIGINYNLVPSSLLLPPKEMV